MHKYCFLNGKIVKTDRPHIALDDIGILRGYAAFDFFRIYNGTPLEFKDHYRRFTESAKVLDLKIPYSQKYLEKVLKELVKKNKKHNYHVRMVLTGGKTIAGLSPSRPHFYILFEKFQDLPKNLFTKGAKLMTYEHERLLPYAKTTNYMQAVQLQQEKNRKGAVEVLYKNNGYITEATTSNIFIVKKGVIYTPKEDVLHGITRKVVIDLAKNVKLKVVEKKITEKEMFNADEVFLTATNKKVLPIVKIDGKKISDGKVGDISRELLKEYNEYIKAYT